MKMNSLCFDDNKGDIEAKSAEGSPTIEVDDIFGDPEVVPRVGDEYQAKIPPLVTALYFSKLMKKTKDSEMPGSFSLGLPSSLMRAHCIIENSCGTLESVTSEVEQGISQNGCSKVEYQTVLLGEGKNVGKNSNFRPSSKCRETGIIDSYPGMQTEIDQSGGKDLLPGLLVHPSWTDIDYDRFLLCLYVFGKKNFKFLKIFVGSKNMGDIMSFYYGKFYRSKGYRRWSVCRKLKTKRYICGQKIFTEWRQQELLSRLFPHVSGECQTVLVEISRSFAEERMPFVEYVFALKDAVGIDLLVAAVGICKGKQDLTSTVAEPTKTNDIFSLRPKLTIGKACSSLTSEDIIKILNGNFRLSKSRSSDLFWEAVWPRLLAKGWHSEQPTDYLPSYSKQCLVFIVPGVKKFSRRLVNGKHYFDSVSDVLTKVASEPGLIETEIQATDGSGDRENGQDKLYLEGLSNKAQNCYLQPHSSKCDQDLTKFTIVDTSVVQGMGQSKVRQLRSLPFETVSVSTISSCSSESEKNATGDSENQAEQAAPSYPIEDQVEHAAPSYRIGDLLQQANSSIPIEAQVEVANSSIPIEDQVEHASASYPIEDQIQQVIASCPIQDQVEQVNSSNPIEDVSDKGVSIDSSHCTPIPEAFNITEVGVKNHKCHSDLYSNKHSREISEHQSIQNMISDCSNYFPDMKMPKLRDCNQGEFSHCTRSTSRIRDFDLNEPITESDQPEASEGAPNMSNEGSATENRMAEEFSGAKSETRMLIDLNFPQVSPEFETDVEIPASMFIMQNDNQCANTSSSPFGVRPINKIQEFPDGHEDHQVIIANRRQSTRNRPLTAKALEALEYEFLNSKRKRKNTDSPDSNSNSRTLHATNGTILSAARDKGIGNAMADTREEEEENVIHEYRYSIDLNKEPCYNM
ncbi:putative transcription regulator Homeodomain-LIKE family [Lupinus albus]|uniref:Putative transcription regulator Homeodomain-LIKE family n=1 Tax=Lupinus albus TaxID=3870 RepID=A0A6A4NWV3_LUPAL|nr:putative transcription regulator Homeodomain-LIKE family [Lupinus albus]